MYKSVTPRRFIMLNPKYAADFLIKICFQLLIKIKIYLRISCSVHPTSVHRKRNHI